MVKHSDFKVMYRPIDPASDPYELVYAEQMFRKFISDGFSYDELSRHPDAPSFASAELLVFILKDWMTEVLSRKDTGNFLIYPLIGVLDSERHAQDTFKALLQVIDRETVELFLRVLDVIWRDPPDDIERLQRVKNYWASWVREQCG